MMENQISRPLSAVERWYWFSDQISALNVIARAKVCGILDAERLRDGLDHLQVRHPLLRARIDDAGGISPEWTATTNKIPLRQATRKGSEHWEREINDRELETRIDPSKGPLMRAVVLLGEDNTHDLIVVLPHIICDGTTALSLLEQWISFAEGADWNSDPLRVLPAPENMLPPEFNGAEGAQRLQSQLAADEKLIKECRPGRVEPTLFVPFEKRRAQLIHRELTSEQIGKITEIARQHDTTVHGALTAALAISAGMDAGGDKTHFAIGSPVNFRDDLKPPVAPNEVGTYVATIATVIDITRPFWEVARSITSQLAERKMRGDHFNLVNLILGAIPGSISEFRPFMETMEAEGPINLVSSNIGRHQFASEIGKLVVSDGQFLAGISVLGYLVATINTSHGRTFWNFTHIDCAFPTERALNLVNDCMQRLLDAMREPAIA